MEPNKTNNALDIDFYVENWIHSVENATIPTIAFPLLDQEIDLILKVNNVLEEAYVSELKRKKDSIDSIPLGESNWLDLPLLDNLKPNLDIICKKIQMEMEKTSSRRFFVKLSLRSAKDSFALKKYEHHYEKLLEASGHPRAVEESFRLGLSVIDAKAALEQIMTSNRVMDDLHRHLKHAEQGTPNPSIILRPWVLIPHCLEFRIFVNKNILTAISSYYRTELYPFLSPLKQTIQENITSFFEKNLKGKLPMASGVLDIGFVMKTEGTQDELFLSEEQISQNVQKGKFQIVLIEVNPFGKCSGSALFSWLEKVLTEGPLEFRLAHEECLL